MAAKHSLTSLIRGAIFTVSLTAALLVFTQFLLPPGDEGGTPAGILFLGFTVGLVNALVAAGIVLIYRTSRIINFAQGALGAVGGLFAFNYTVISGWPYLLAALVGLVASALIGMAVELGIIRRFFFAPRLVLTALTIVLALFLTFAAGFLFLAPIFPGIEDVGPQELSAQVSLPFSDFAFRVGDLALDFGFGHVFAIGMSLLALAGLGLFLRLSRVGTAIRAVSENAERASLLGISIKSLSTIVWTIAAALAGLGVILTGSITRFADVSGIAPAALVPALAAAVVGRMRSLPIAAVMAVAIAVVRQAVQWNYSDQVVLVDGGIFLIIAIGLLVQRKEFQRSEQTEAASWEASEEIRPIPRELIQVTGVRLSRWVLIAVVIGGVLLFPWVTTTGPIQLAGFIAIFAIIILSLVVLTGWAGQVSLGQFALVAIAGVVGGALTSRVGLSFWLAVPVTTAFMAGFSALIGLPALRIRGLYLAIATFAFAFAVQSTLFQESYFGWLLPDFVARPGLFLLDFEDERSMYYLTVAGLGLAILVVTILRRSRPGRVLVGLRENEANLQSFGVNVVKARLSAFALSGALCGFAGVLLTHHQRAITVAALGTQEDLAQQSLNVFLFAAVGGVGSVWGAVLGTGWFALTQFFQGTNWSLIFGPLGALVILYFQPGGLASLASGARDGILRIVAQRRQLVVPALFADFDPEALARRLVPLAETIPGTGLGALPYDLRYRAISEIYWARGKMTAARARRPGDEDVIGAAGRRLGGETEEGATAAPPAESTEGTGK